MRRHLKNLSKFLAISFFTLYCLIWVLSPIVTSYVTNNYALPSGYALTSNSSIRYNPFTAHLTVNDLELQHESDITLRMKALDVELHLHQLLFDTIYIAEFDITGMYIPVITGENSLKVAGFELMNKAPDDAEDAQENDTPTVKKEFPYQIVLPDFNLTDSKIDINHLGKNHQVEIDSLSISSFAFSEKEQSLALILESKINQAPVDVEINTELVQQLGSLDLSVSIEKFALHHAQVFLPENLQALNGELSYSNKLDVELFSDKTLVNVNQLLLSLDDFSVQENDLIVNVAHKQIQSDDMSITLAPEKPVSIDATFVADISDIFVKTKINDESLVKVANIAFNGISLMMKENKPHVTVSRLNVSEGMFSESKTKELPALAAFQELAINDIKYQPSGIAIQDITLSGLVSNIFLDENKQLSTLIHLTDKESETAAVEVAAGKDESEQANSTETKGAHTEPMFGFKLGEFKLLDNAIIDFKDTSVNPHYERNINISKLSLASIDTLKPDLESVFNLQGKSDKYAYFTVNGRGQPFAESQSFTVDANLKEVSLPGVSSYIKEALKYEIESGQLDVNINAGLIGTEIDGDVDLLLRGVEFTAADDHETGTVTDQTSVPFNVALGMLKDSDGNVELSVPLSGDTSSPSFGFSGFLTLLVKQATMSAAKDYLLTTFVPYASVMKVAMAAGEYALKLRINDLNYLPTEVELNAEQIEFSRQMSVMLQDQADINVKLCAIATPADIAVHSADEAHLEANIKRLKAISQQRVDLFKAHMVEELQVPSAKLLLCTPQIDTSADAVSRIEFVI